MRSSFPTGAISTEKAATATVPTAEAVPIAEAAAAVMIAAKRNEKIFF